MTTRPVAPRRDSHRTYDRAIALASSRGCDQANDCWPECCEVALDDIVEGCLNEDERKKATTSRYWHYTHGGRDA